MRAMSIVIHSVALAITDAFGIDRNDIGVLDGDVTNWRKGIDECVDASATRGALNVHLEHDLHRDGRIHLSWLTLTRMEDGFILLKMHSTPDGVAVDVVSTMPETMRRAATGSKLADVLAIDGIAFPDIAVLAITQSANADMVTIRLADDWRQLRIRPGTGIGRNTTHAGTGGCGGNER